MASATPTATYIREFGGGGSGVGQLSVPGGIATDPEGNIWVADTGHNRIQQFSPEGEFISQFGGAGQLTAPRGIAIDSEGNVLVADSGHDRVKVFTAKGELVRSIGEHGSSNGKFNALKDVAIDPEGNIWTLETVPTKARVQEFDPEGKFIRSFGSVGTGNGQFDEPQGIATDAEGNVWVADTDNNRIQQFNSKGEFVRKFGTVGAGNGQFKAPSALNVDSEGNVWVADSDNNRVQELTAEGTYLSQFGKAGNDDGQFSEPQGIATDAEGNVWIADTGNDRIQEVAASEFVLKFGGEGSGAGQLSAPSEVATDSEGDVWVADTAHNRIQQFDPEGEFISQFGAKGEATGLFDRPHGIAIDSEDNVWVADTYNDRLQQFSSEGEFIRSFGDNGTGNGKFREPHGIAIDSEGNVWVADTFNNRVQEFNYKGEYIRKFGSVGSENNQFTEPQGIAIDSKGNVWVADTGNNRIKETTYKGEFIRKFGTEGTGNGQLASPSALSFDSEGDLWIADTGNDRLQEFDDEGTYLSQFGTTGHKDGRFAEPKGLAIDSEGNAWIADTGNDRIQEVAASEFVQSFGGEGSEAGLLSEPVSIATDSKGNVWVADTAHNRIQEFDSEGELVRRFGSLGTENGQFEEPLGIAVDPEGNVWVTDHAANRVQEFDSKGKFIRKFGSEGYTDGKFRYPWGIAADAEGNVWVVDTGNDRVQVFNSKGEFKGKFGSEGAGNGQFKEPRGIAIDDEGNVWIADTGNDRIQQFNLKGEFVRKFGIAGTGAGQLESPASVGVDPEGSVWVADTANDRVQQFGAEGKYLGQFGSTGNDAGKFSGPKGVALDSDGTIWVADTANNRVQEWMVSGYMLSYLSAFGTFGTDDGQFEHPADVALDAEGDIWVVDQNNARVVEFNEAGEYVRKFGSLGTGNGEFDRPAALAIDPDGNVWVADAENNRIQQFDPEGEFIRSVGSEGEGDGEFYSPEGIAIDATGNVWVSDTYNGRLQEFDDEGEFIKVVSSYGSEEGQLGEPTGIDIDSSGNVWVADWQNNRISEFSEDGDFVRQFGSGGSGNGQFASPDALAIDARGNVWVGDEGNNRIQKFSRTGRYLTQFGTEGTSEGQFNFGWPMGIAADSKGDIWVTDSENNRVQRWQVYPGPDTVISGEPKEVVAPNVSFSFASSKTGSSFECSIDGGTYSTCSSPKSYTSLAAGAHTFRVRAVDAIGYRDETPAELSFEVAKPPTVSTEGATGIGSNEATLQASVNPNGIETTYQFEYGLTTDYGEVVPAVAKSAGSGSQAIPRARLVTGLEAATTYHFRVVATSGSGTVPGSDETFTTLEPSPVSLLVFGQAAESPSGALVSPQQPLSVSAGNEGGKIEELQLSIDGEIDSTTTRQEALEEDGTESCFEGVCTLSYEYPSVFPPDIAPGQHAFEVRAVSAAGEEETFTRQVLVDAGIPTLELGGTLVEANGNLSSSYSSATVTASVQDGTGSYDSGLSSIEFYVDGVYQSGMSAECSEGCPAEGNSNYEYLEQEWGTGPHELTVVARDAAGNEDSNAVMVNQQLEAIEPSCSTAKATAAAVGKAASTTEAVETIQAILPAAVAPPTPDPEAESFEPTLIEGEAASEGVEAFLARGGLVGGRIVRGLHRAFTIGQATCLVPMQTTKSESAPEVLPDAGTVVYANTAPETDTFIRNNGVGATVIQSFRGPNIPTSLSWTVSLESGQQLKELGSGGVAVVSPKGIDLPEAQLPSPPPGIDDPEMLGDTETVLDVASYELRRANNEVEGAVEAVIPPALVIGSGGAVQGLSLTVAGGVRVVATVPTGAEAMVMQTASSPHPDAVCAAPFEGDDPADYANGCLLEQDRGGERPYITGMDWAPDGSFVYTAFWDETGVAWEKYLDWNPAESFLYRASADGLELEELETPGFKVIGAPKVSPDGTKIVFNGCSLVSFECGVVLANASGEDGTLVATTKGNTMESRVGFSSNGSRLLYEKGVLVGPGSQEERQIYSVKLDGTGQRQLTDISTNWATVFSHKIGWSGRGTLNNAAVAADPTSDTLVLEGWNYGLFAMHESQEKADLFANMTRLTYEPGRAPAFNPAGTKIAYSYGGGQGNSGIFVVNKDGSGKKLVVPSPQPYEERAIYPVYSHDGSELAYIRNGLIYRVPASGGPATLAVESDTSGFRSLAGAIAESDPDPTHLSHVEAAETAVLASSSSSSDPVSEGLDVVEEMNQWEIEFCITHLGECKAFADDRELALNARDALFTNRNKIDRSTRGNAFQHGFWTALMVRDSKGEYEGVPNGLLFALRHEVKPYDWDARQDIVNDFVGYFWFIKDGIEIVSETESEIKVRYVNKLEVCQGLLPKGKNAIFIGGGVNPFWWIHHHQYEFGRLIFRKLRSRNGKGPKVWPNGRTCAEVWSAIT